MNAFAPLRFVVWAVVALALPNVSRAAEDATTASAPPNVVIIFIDDLGYADIGPFGATKYQTPNLDRMAAEGRKFTDFHSATAVCSASRAALLTGCYPERVSILGALYPGSRNGIHDDETTLGELFKSRDYATAIFGKWHLGHHPQYLPLRHGFDEYYGLPYSNDMWPYHPEIVRRDAKVARRKQGMPPLPLIEGNEIIDAEVTAEEQADLTTAYTERAVDFINRHRDEPFFLYVPHTMVHVPLFVSEKFRDKSGAGLYGDVVMEVDWSVGQILDAIEKNGLDEKTLVIFASDNGPWLSYGDHGGSAGPLREGKGTMFEGGYRVPCIMRWPGKIPPGTECDQFAVTFDLFPTIASLIGAELPADRKIDGKNIWPLISAEPGAESPHDIFYCYFNGQLRAVRDGRWKLVLPHTYTSLQGRPGGEGGFPTSYDQVQAEFALYDLENDLGETTSVADQHPDVVERLEQAVEAARTSLGDTLTDRTGSEIRPAGSLAP